MRWNTEYHGQDENEKKDNTIELIDRLGVVEVKALKAENAWVRDWYTNIANGLRDEILEILIKEKNENNK